MPPTSLPGSAGPPAPPRSRRRLPWLVAAVVAATVALLVGAGVGAVVHTWASLGQSNVGTVALDRPLAIPPLAVPTVEPDGTKVFDLRVAAGTTELLPGRATPTWGVNGTYLGPTIRASRGDRVRVRVANDLDRTTTMHWHGMHLPAEADGGPMQPIDPGTRWEPSWTVDQPAATLWYHPHLHEETAEQVYRGVAGLFVVDDPAADALDLPRDYGVDDIPVIVQDKSFHDDGTLDLGHPLLREVGLVGDHILVNGTYSPMLRVTRRATRLRILNASNARPYDLGFTSGRPFALVGTDSGLLPAPVEVSRVRLAPGERAEVVVTMAPGDDDVIRSFPSAIGAGFVVDRAAGAQDTMDVLRLRADPSLVPSPPLPASLVPIDPIDDGSIVTTRELSFSGTTINGRSLDMDRIDARARVGTAERWIVSGDAGLHAFHVHDTRFLVRAVDGQAPPPPLSGWKDTLWLEPGRRFELVMRFDDYADAHHAYMFHCHVLRHEDQGMMGQLLVVDDPPAPGDGAAGATGNPAPASGHGDGTGPGEHGGHR